MAVRLLRSVRLRPWYRKTLSFRSWLLLVVINWLLPVGMGGVIKFHLNLCAVVKFHLKLCRSLSNRVWFSRPKTQLRTHVRGPTERISRSNANPNVAIPTASDAPGMTRFERTRTLPMKPSPTSSFDRSKRSIVEKVSVTRRVTSVPT